MAYFSTFIPGSIKAIDETYREFFSGDTDKLVSHYEDAAIKATSVAQSLQSHLIKIRINNLDQSSKQELVKEMKTLEALMDKMRTAAVDENLTLVTTLRTVLFDTCSRITEISTRQ